MPNRDKPQRLDAVRLAAAICIWLLYALLCARSYLRLRRLPAWDHLADLHVYYGAVGRLTNGQLYSYHAPNGDPFTYPPFAALVLWPIRLLSEVDLRIIWTIATYALIPAFALCVHRSLAAQLRRHDRSVFVPIASILILMSAPLVSNLHFGQISYLLTLAVALDVLELAPVWSRGFLTGVAAAVKLTPLMFVPYLWITGRRRAAAVSLVSFVGCTLIALLVLPHESLNYWLTDVWQTSRIGDLAQGGNSSLNGVLLRTGLPGVYEKLLWLAMAVCVVSVGLVGARRLWLYQDRLQSVACVGAAEIAISPVSWTHHLVWLLPVCIGLASWSVVTKCAWFTATYFVMYSSHTGIPVEDARCALAVVACLVLPMLRGRPVAHLDQAAGQTYTQLVSPRSTARRTSPTSPLSAKRLPKSRRTDVEFSESMTVPHQERDESTAVP
jgi:alpha-1,2-mannosyltransferase